MRWKKRSTALRERGWHPWFAWRPVREEDVWFWMEIVERKVRYYDPPFFSTWDYRAPQTCEKEQQGGEK